MTLMDAVVATAPRQTTGKRQRNSHEKKLMMMMMTGGNGNGGGVRNYCFAPMPLNVIAQMVWVTGAVL